MAKNRDQMIGEMLAESRKAISSHLLFRFGNDEYRKHKFPEHRKVLELQAKHEQGEYGNCGSCRKPIPVKDLRQDVFLVHCKKCREKNTEFTRLIERQKGRSAGEISIEDLFPLRVEYALLNARMKTVQDILHAGRQRLMLTKKLGAKGVARIEGILRELGFELSE